MARKASGKGRPIQKLASLERNNMRPCASDTATRALLGTAASKRSPRTSNRSTGSRVPPPPRTLRTGWNKTTTHRPDKGPTETPTVMPSAVRA
jgi:hypothetical protein